MATIEETVEAFNGMMMVAEKVGATIATNKNGEVADIFFTPSQLMNFCDFWITYALDNYEEIQNSPDV